jgi:hypothetical protein
LSRLVCYQAPPPTQKQIQNAVAEGCDCSKRSFS